jgi:hypothetical protein
MKRLVAASVCIVVGAELVAMLLPDHRFVPWISGLAVAVVLVAVRRFLGHDIEPVPTEPECDDGGESLRRWLSRTQTLIRWSESTRSDWDRHLRPMLARQFGTATGQTQAKDPAAYQATGRMLFGAELWGWVDPENVARTGGRRPGPGRAVLDEILQRLEQV